MFNFLSLYPFSFNFSEAQGLGEAIEYTVTKLAMLRFVSSKQKGEKMYEKWVIPY